MGFVYGMGVLGFSSGEDGEFLVVWNLDVLSALLFLSCENTSRI